MFLQALEVGPVAENCYILGDERSRQCLIIDPGAEPDRIISAIAAAGLTPQKIINTHGHPDHVGAVVPIQRHFAIPFWMHEADVFLLNALPAFAMYVGEPSPQIPTMDAFLHEGQTVTCGSLALRVAHTPGHTPGGVCFILDAEKTVLAGDTLFAGSIGRTDLPGGDHAQLLQSIREKLMTLPDDYTVYCGHGPHTTIGQERKTNPFLIPHPHLPHRGEGMGKV